MLALMLVISSFELQNSVNESNRREIQLGVIIEKKGYND